MLIDETRKPSRKLVLHKETVRILTGDGLLAAHRAARPTDDDCDTRLCPPTGEKCQSGVTNVNCGSAIRETEACPETSDCPGPDSDDEDDEDDDE